MMRKMLMPFFFSRFHFPFPNTVYSLPTAINSEHLTHFPIFCHTLELLVEVKVSMEVVGAVIKVTRDF